MSLSSQRHSASGESATDLELVAQRIVKLAEIATLEHIESLLASQAGGMLLAMQERESKPLPEAVV